MSKNSGNSGGIGFLGLLTLLFIGLRLANVIDWQWRWVLAPLWLPVVVLLAGAVFFVGYVVVRKSGRL